MNQDRVNKFMLVWVPLLILLSIAGTVALSFTINTDIFLFNESVPMASREELKNSCLDSAGKLKHITIQPNSYDLRVSADLSQGVASLVLFSEISVLLASCEGYKLDYFCAGKGCQPSNKITANFAMDDFYK